MADYSPGLATNGDVALPGPLDGKDKDHEALGFGYEGVAARIVTYLAMGDLRRNPKNLPRWGEISNAIRGN